MQEHDPQPLPEGKETYHSPQLVLYGTIVELTQASKGGMVLDGEVGVGKMGFRFLKSTF